MDSTQPIGMDVVRQLPDQYSQPPVLSYAAAGDDSGQFDIAPLRLDGVLAESARGAFVADGGGRILAANEALGRLLGRAPELLQGRWLRDVFCEENQTLPDWPRGNAAPAWGHEADVRVVRADGRVVRTRLVLVSVPDRSGVSRLLGLVAVPPEDIHGFAAARPEVSHDQQQDAPPAEEPTGPADCDMASRPSDAATRVARMFRLTACEAEVFELLLAGRRLKEIASRRGVSVQAVWKHRQRILAKTGVENEVQLLHVVQRYAAAPAWRSKPAAAPAFHPQDG